MEPPWARTFLFCDVLLSQYANLCIFIMAQLVEQDGGIWNDFEQISIAIQLNMGSRLTTQRAIDAAYDALPWGQDVTLCRLNSTTKECEIMTTLRFAQNRHDANPVRTIRKIGGALDTDQHRCEMRWEADWKGSVSIVLTLYFVGRGAIHTHYLMPYTHHGLIYVSSSHWTEDTMWASFWPYHIHWPVADSPCPAS